MSDFITFHLVYYPNAGLNTHEKIPFKLTLIKVIFPTRPFVYVSIVFTSCIVAAQTFDNVRLPRDIID